MEALQVVDEDPPVRYGVRCRSRWCASCGHLQAAYYLASLSPDMHFCRRDEVVTLATWPIHR